MNNDMELKQMVKEAYENSLIARRNSERALAYSEIMKVWSAHSYGYRAQQQRFELENYWAKEHDDIMYAHGTSAYVGRELVTDYYAGGNERMNRGKLKIMSELFPDEIENIDKNLGLGDLVIRCTTTPYIEVAEDCKTAKGVFYTIGFNSENDAKGDPIPMFMIGREAVDFVKESDGWKIWHLRDSPDMGFAVDPEVVLREPNMDSRTVNGAFPKYNRNLVPFKETGRFFHRRAANFSPELPTPYDTWSDDISWAKPAEASE